MQRIRFLFVLRSFLKVLRKELLKVPKSLSQSQSDSHTDIGADKKGRFPDIADKAFTEEKVDLQSGSY